MEFVAAVFGIVLCGGRDIIQNWYAWLKAEAEIAMKDDHSKADVWVAHSQT